MSQINFTDIHGGDKIILPQTAHGGGILTIVLDNANGLSKKIQEPPPNYSVVLSVKQSGSTIWSTTISGMSIVKDGNNFTFSGDLSANALTGKILCTVRAVLYDNTTQLCSKDVTPVEFVAIPNNDGFSAKSKPDIASLIKEAINSGPFDDLAVITFEVPITNAYLHFLLVNDEEQSPNPFSPALYSILPLKQLLHIPLVSASKSEIRKTHKRLSDTYVRCSPFNRIILKAIGVDGLGDIVATKTLDIDHL